MKGLVGCLVVALVGRASAQEFDAAAQVGGISGGAEEGPTTTANAPNTALPDFNIPLSKPTARSIGPLPRLCECGTVNTDTSDIQTISDTWCDGGGAGGNSYGMSNMVWSWGQFLDHEIVGTIDDENGPSFVIDLANNRKMSVHRVRSQGATCPNPLNIHTGTVDGATVYSPRTIFEKKLRALPGCHLREGDQAGFLPLTTRADDEGRFFIVAGDGRVDEHAALTSMHTLWLREHNRLCDVIQADPQLSTMSFGQQFNIVKAVVTAKMQQITVTGFLPALGIIQADLEASTGKVGSSMVSVEFSMAYRLGHTMIPDKVGSIDIASLFDGQKNFLNNEAGGVGYKPDADAILDNIFTQLTSTAAAEMDGKMSNALRNILFGEELQEDLCARNIFRGREMAMPSYAGIASCFGQTPDATVEAETPDMWLGLLREPRAPGFPLGPTHRAILIEQFGRSFFGPQGLWWKTDSKLSGLTSEFTAEIESTTLGKVISDNTGASVSGNAFAA